MPDRIDSQPLTRVRLIREQRWRRQSDEESGAGRRKGESGPGRRTRTDRQDQGGSNRSGSSGGIDEFA